MEKREDSELADGEKRRFRETKDTVRVSLQEYLFTGSSKVTSYGRKSPHAHTNKIGTSTPPLLRNPNTPPKRRNFMGMGVFQQKEAKMPGAHKISVAISGPRITGGTFMDITLFLIWFWQKRVRLSDLLEGGLTLLQEPTLTVLLVLPNLDVGKRCSKGKRWCGRTGQNSFCSSSGIIVCCGEG